MQKQNVRQVEVVVIPEKAPDAKIEGFATIVGLTNSFGEVTVELAVASTEDGLGGTFAIFQRRKTTRGWLPWIETEGGKDQMKEREN